MAKIERTARWWEADSSGISHAAIAAVNSIQEANKGQLQRMHRALKAYGGRGFMSGGRFPTNMGLGGSLGQGQRQGPRDNIVYAAVATIQSQMFDMGAPGVTFMTMHGNYEQQVRAKLLEQFTDGLAYQSNLDEETLLQLQDALITGTGYVKHWLDADNSIWSTRTFPAEIMVDMWDGRDRAPRSMHQVGFVDRDVLAARYPKKEKKIMSVDAHLLADYYTSSTHSTNNLIPFIESWHLPRSRESGDGRHVLLIGLDDGPILDEEYADDDFPFSVLRYEMLPTSFQGMGVAELIAGHQLSINNCDTAAYWAWSQVAAPRIFARAGTLNLDHLNSSLSGIVLEGKEPPQIMNWAGTHPEFMPYRNGIKLGAFAMVGADAKAAAGIDTLGPDASGEARREHKATLRSRFSVPMSRWQANRVDCAKKQIALARRAYENDRSFSVKVIGKGFIKTIKFKDCSLEDDEYVMQPKAISQLPKDPEGQIQTATELLQSSLVPIDSARSVLTAVPDLGAETDLANAAYDNAKRTAYLMLAEGKPQQPFAGQNVQLVAQVVNAEMLKAYDQEAPQERIQLCQNWLNLASKPPFNIPPPNMPQPAAPGAMPGAPPPIAQGQAAPHSDLLPFKPATAR